MKNGFMFFRSGLNLLGVGGYCLSLHQTCHRIGTSLPDSVGQKFEGALVPRGSRIRGVVNPPLPPTCQLRADITMPKAQCLTPDARNALSTQSGQHCGENGGKNMSSIICIYLDPETTRQHRNRPTCWGNNNFEGTYMDK